MRFLANDLTLTREECLELLVRPKTHIALDIETVSIENTLMLGIGMVTGYSKRLKALTQNLAYLACVID